MKLRNLLPHKAGTIVSVNGTEYHIDNEGFVDVDKHDDANKLLANPQAWVIWDGSKTPLTVKKEKVVKDPVVNAPSKDVVKIDEEKIALGVAKEPIKSPEITTEDEWPDPDESMDIEYLRQMADAYEVKYTANLGKKILINKIKKAMYED